MAAQLAAATLGEDQDQFKQWLNDPQKLLEMIAAAQGSTSGGGDRPGAGGRAGAAPGRGRAGRFRTAPRAIKTRDAGFMFWLTRRNPDGARARILLQFAIE